MIENADKILYPARQGLVFFGSLWTAFLARVPKWVFRRWMRSWFFTVKMCLMVSKWWNGGEKQWPGFVFFEVFGTGFVKCKDVIFEWMRAKVFLVDYVGCYWFRMMPEWWKSDGQGLCSLKFGQEILKCKKVVFRMWSSVSWMQLVLLLVSSLTAHDEWMYCVKQGSFCSSWAWTEDAKARWVRLLVGLLLAGFFYDRKVQFGLYQTRPG